MNQSRAYIFDEPPSLVGLEALPAAVVDVQSKATQPEKQTDDQAPKCALSNNIHLYKQCCAAEDCEKQALRKKCKLVN